MTALVCARCEAVVTAERKMPTMPTKIPTRRLFGSSACSGLSSISAMGPIILQASRLRDGSFHSVQSWIRPGDSQHARANDFDDLTERRDIGDEFADLDLRTGQLDDVTGGMRRQHLAADTAQ